MASLDSKQLTKFTLQGTAKNDLFTLGEVASTFATSTWDAQPDINNNHRQDSDDDSSLPSWDDAPVAFTQDAQSPASFDAWDFNTTSNGWNFEESKASSCDLSWDAPATFVQVKPKHVPASSLSWDDEATSVAPHSQLSVHNHEMNSNSWLA
jgi:hypothetical protein